MRYAIFYILVFLLSMIAPAFSAIESSDEKKPSNETASEEDKPKAIREIEEHYGLCEDEALNDKLKRVSEKILACLTEDEKARDFKFKVLDDDEVNAFAVPDGHMYFFSGLVEFTKSDDMLAGVVAHEMTHVIKKHSREITNEALPWLIGGILVSIVANEPHAALAGEWIAEATAQKYTRSAEEEADSVGLDIVLRAGYDPIGMLEFFSLLVEEEKRNPILFHNYFFTHPFAHERVDNLKELLRRRGYTVPDSLYRSYLKSESDVREEGEIIFMDIKFGDDVLFTIAGDDKDALEKRAKGINDKFDEVLKAGAKRFDFRIVRDDDRSWIQAKGRVIFEPDEFDIENSGVSPEIYLKNALDRIQRFLWEESLKRGI